MGQQQQISADKAAQVGARLGFDWTKVAREQFRRGLEVELEHGARDAETNVTGNDMTLTKEKDHERTLCFHIVHSDGIGSL